MKILIQKNVNGVTWTKRYAFVATNGIANLNTMLGRIGRSGANFPPTPDPLMKRYFTDLRFEEVENHSDNVVADYLYGLVADTNMVPFVKKDNFVSTNRDTRRLDEVYGSEATSQATDIFSPVDMDRISKMEENLLNINIDEILAGTLFPDDENIYIDEEASGNDGMFRKGCKVKGARGGKVRNKKSTTNKKLKNVKIVKRGVRNRKGGRIG